MTRPPATSHTATCGPMTSVLNELVPVLNARRKMAELYQKEAAELCRKETELSQQRQACSQPACVNKFSYQVTVSPVSNVLKRHDSFADGDRVGNPDSQPQQENP
jgi:hypothetical protein